MSAVEVHKSALDRWDGLAEEGAQPEAAHGSSSQVPNNNDIHHDEQQQQSQNKRWRRLLLQLFLVVVLVGAVAAAIAIPLSTDDENDNNERADMSSSISAVKEEDENQVVYFNTTTTTTDAPTTAHAPSTETTTPAPITGVTMAELQQHAAEDDCWVAFHDTVYDMTEYAPTHPGSASVIYDVCGRDGTKQFETFHFQSYLDMVFEYIVGLLLAVQEGVPQATPTPVLQPPDPSPPSWIPQEPVGLPAAAPGERIDLPAPATGSGGMALTETLAQRRSVRSYGDGPLTVAEISQLLWATQGETSDYKRTAPSAGALYPLELYLVAASGLYHYHPDGHALTVLDAADLRSALSDAALSQEQVAAAPAVFVLAAVYERTEPKYGGRAARYVHMEAGHAGQNLLLQAVGIGLGGVPTGAFDDDEVQAVLGLPQDHKPLYLIPVGRPQP